MVWKPPVSKEEEKKFTWTPPKPIVKEEEVVKGTWQPPKPQPLPEPIDLSKYTAQGYDEPTWTDIAFHATKAGVADLQTSMLNLGKLMYESGSQMTDKITDLFDKDLYDPKKDKLRRWLEKLVTDSEAVADESWEQIVSKNRIKNLVSLVGRAVPLSLITLLSGGAIAGAYPALAMKIGALPTAMLPFAASATGSHARRIEREFEARGQEAPFAAELIGGIMGAMGEVATEAIPFQRWLNVFGGSRVINRGAKTFLAKYGKLGIDWAVAAATETLQEVAMVPVEKSISNIIHDEREPLLPKEEMIQAGMVGFGLSLVLGGLGSSNSAIRSFAEDKVDKMLKFEITRREGTLDIAEKVVDEAEPETKEEEYLPDEPTSDESVEEQFVRKNVRKVVPKFPRSEYEVTSEFTLARLGDSIAREVGLDPLNITWKLSESRRGITGTHHGIYAVDRKGAPKPGNEITIRLPKDPATGTYLGGAESLLGGRRRAPSHGTLVKVILHELGHMASPPVKTDGRQIHTAAFHRWTVDSVGKLWMETPLLSEAEFEADKALRKIEIEKARVCEKYGLDPKDFKHTTLPKGKIETSPVEEDASKITEELRDAGYGIEKPLGKEPTAKQLLAREKINDDKVKVHTMSKDEFVKQMTKNKELDVGDQEVAEATFRAEQEEIPALPTPEGVNLSGKMQLYLKIIRGTLILDPSAKNVYDALAEMEGTIAEAEYVCQQVRDTWEKMVPKIEDEVLIDKYCDMPDKYQAEITERGLQNEADWIIRQYKRLAEIAKKANAIGGVWRNYSPFTFKNIHEWMRVNPDAGVPVSGMLGTMFAHGIERNIQNYDEAEKMGLIPEHKVGLKLSAYMFSLSKVVAHKNFIDIVRNMTDEKGHAVATTLDSREEWARDYKQVANPEFAKYMMVERRGKMTRIPIRWKPEVADAIEEIVVPAWMQSKPMRNIRMVKGIVKRIIFLNPAIHGWNIFSDVLDEVNFNFIKAIDAIRPRGKGAQIYLTNTRLTREALKANLNLAHTGRLGRRIRAEIYDLIPVEGKNVITKGIGKLFAWNDNVLWTTIVRNAQMYTYALKREQGLPPKLAASFTNDLLGTLPKRYFTNFEWGVATSFFLARNWTISNLRLLTGAIGPMANIIPIKALTRKDMSPADMKLLAPHYIRHLIKGMFGLIMLTNLVNKLLTGKWALENEPGHKMDIKMGNAKDNKGRDIYVVMPLLRYMRDYLGWATQPRRTLWNKMEPVAKTSLELLINHSMWQNRKIMHPESPIPEKIKDAAEYALWSWTPFDQFLDSENEVKTRLQKMMYFTGTWIRRGSSISSHSFNTLRTEEKIEFVQTLSPKLVNELYGNLAIGRIYGEVAKKLYDFRSAKGYVKEKLDNSIDRLLTGGDIPGAIELMVESGRYKDFSAIKDRIMPYLMLRK